MGREGQEKEKEERLAASDKRGEGKILKQRGGKRLSLCKLGREKNESTRARRP